MRKVQLHDIERVVAEQDNCLAGAITDILLNSSDQGSTDIVLVLP